MFRLALFSINLFLFSCSHQDQGSAVKNQGRGFLSYSLNFNFKTQYKSSSQEITKLNLVYKREVENQRFRFEDLEKTPHQLVLLIAYLDNCAYNFLSKGHHYPHVSISHSGSPNDLTGNTWFRHLDSETFYDKKTLAIKNAKTIYSFDPKEPSGEWLPLDEKSYSKWWNQLNEKFSLEEKFGRPIPNS